MADEFRLYRFSPITRTGVLQQATSYVATRARHMARVICGQSWNRDCELSGLTIFSHYQAEFTTLCKLAEGIGPVIAQHNGPYVDTAGNLDIAGGAPRLRIRQPDPYRTQVGCCDLVVDSYAKFKAAYVKPSNPHLRVIQRPEYEMVEFFHPDYDVLAYVVSD